MKLLNKKQKNNKGFSLVELIVVIAIMVVLVAVLAPLFTKYIESSRRATDVQNANSIAEATYADVADGEDVPASFTVDGAAATGNYLPSAVKEAPVVKGDAVDGAKGQKFTGTYNKTTNKVAIFAGSDTTMDLTDETKAAEYKNK